MIERLLAAEAALERGDEAEAERAYTMLVETDPRNAIAVVGLARLALRRGDRTDAEALAQRALAIDPDEAAAAALIAAMADEGPSGPAATGGPSGRPGGADRMPAPQAGGVLGRLRRWLGGGPDA